MTGNNLLLDNQHCYWIIRGNSSVEASLETKRIINIPFAVLGKLYLGAYRSSNPKKHITQISDFLKKCNLLTADHETADYYALIKSELLKKGKPIPENDIWIAATVKQYKLSLVTRDKHFNEINGLTIENW